MWIRYLKGRFYLSTPSNDLVIVAGELGKPICKKDDTYYVVDSVIYEWRKTKN